LVIMLVSIRPYWSVFNFSNIEPQFRQVLLLQKVTTDRPGHLSRSCSFDPEVVEP
jgi:hypothetical protein